jgi:hypothetical protein
VGRLALAWTALKAVLAAGPFALAHFHDPELVPAMAVLGLLRPGCYTLYDIHEDLPLQMESKGYLPGWIRFPMARLADWMLHLASGCFTGFAPATEAISRSWPSAQTRIVHNYPKAVFSQAGVPDVPVDPDRVLYVGGLAAGRGILVVLEALALARGTRPRLGLELVGEIMEPEVERAIRAAEAQGWCRHIPWLFPEQLAAHAAGCGVGLVTLLPQPNYLESLPTKLFEYMAMGIPVLASDFPLWRRLVADSGAGRVVRPEPEAVAAALLAMVQDRDGLRRHAEAGRAAYRDRYRWEAEAGNLRWHLVRAGLTPSR